MVLPPGQAHSSAKGTFALVASSRFKDRPPTADSQGVETTEGPPHVTVREVMTPQPIAVSPEATVYEAVHLMRENGCRHLPVVRAGWLVGVVSSKDVDCACLKTRMVGEVMTRNPLTATSTEPVEVAAATMALAKVDCLPVLEQGQLVGIVTTYDALDLLCRRLRERRDAPGPASPDRVGAIGA
jgi:acetoin utilization protein AcuB